MKKRRYSVLSFFCCIAVLFSLSPAGSADDESAMPDPEPMYSTGTVDVQGDYFVNPGQSTYAYHVVIVRNTSDETRNVTIHTWFYDGGGEQVTEEDSTIWALGPGCTSFVEDTINTKDYDVAEWEIVLDDEPSDDTFFSVLEDLSHSCEISGDNALVTVYNNGGRTAEYPLGLALFFSGDELVDVDITSFCAVNLDLPAGEYYSKKLNAHYAKNFDRVEFYLDTHSLEREPSAHRQSAQQAERRTKIVQEYTWVVNKKICYCAVVENISDQPVRVEVSGRAYDAHEKMLDLAYDRETIPPGQRSLLIDSFTDLVSDRTVSIRKKLYESDANTAPFESLAITQTPVSHGVVFTVTNNGDQTFDKLGFYVLFIKNSKVVKNTWQSFINSNGPLLPGGTTSILVDAGCDFDEVLFSFKE